MSSSSSSSSPISSFRSSSSSSIGSMGDVSGSSPRHSAAVANTVSRGFFGSIVDLAYNAGNGAVSLAYGAGKTVISVPRRVIVASCDMATQGLYYAGVWQRTCAQARTKEEYSMALTSDIKQPFVCTMSLHELAVNDVKVAACEEKKSGETYEQKKTDIAGKQNDNCPVFKLKIYEAVEYEESKAEAIIAAFKADLMEKMCLAVQARYDNKDFGMVAKPCDAGSLVLTDNGEGEIRTDCRISLAKGGDSIHRRAGYRQTGIL